MTIGIVQRELASESTGRQAALMLPGIVFLYPILTIIAVRINEGESILAGQEPVTSIPNFSFTLCLIQSIASSLELNVFDSHSVSSIYAFQI